MKYLITKNKKSEQRLMILLKINDQSILRQSIQIKDKQINLFFHYNLKMYLSFII